MITNLPIMLLLAVLVNALFVTTSIILFVKLYKSKQHLKSLGKLCDDYNTEIFESKIRFESLNKIHDQGIKVNNDLVDILRQEITNLDNKINNPHPIDSDMRIESAYINELGLFRLNSDDACPYSVHESVNMDNREVYVKYYDDYVPMIVLMYDISVGYVLTDKEMLKEPKFYPFSKVVLSMDKYVKGYALMEAGDVIDFVITEFTDEATEYEKEEEQTEEKTDEVNPTTSDDDHFEDGPGEPRTHEEDDPI